MSESNYQITNGSVVCPCCGRQIDIFELLSQLFEEKSLLIECDGCDATIDFCSDMSYEVISND
jgi:hypothetical protein